MALSERDYNIIADFIDQFESEFADHLEDYEIDGSETGTFMDELRLEGERKFESRTICNCARNRNRDCAYCDEDTGECTA